MPQVTGSKHLTQATWDDVPHLDEATKKELWDSTPPHLRDARAKGIPALGSGAIYPIPLEEVLCDPFPIPDHYKRAYGLDVGWNKTAAVWIAEDPTSRVRYAYAEHYRGQAEPAIHAAAIKARGDWIPGAIDPAARGRQQVDGRQLIVAYQEQSLDIRPAINAVEAGLYEVFAALSTGRLMIFRTLQNVQAEFKLYRRYPEDHPRVGQVVKEFDHAMDALRYGYMTFDSMAKTRPAEQHQFLGYASSPADTTAGY